MPAPDLLELFAFWYVAFLLSLTCHEAAHALAAKWGGDLTAFRGGQVSLNPMPHIQREPFGTVVFPILTYVFGGWMMGWASAPYDPDWQRRYPHRAAWMALAGPLANVALVLVAAVGMRIGVELGFFELPEYAEFAQVVIGTAGGLREGAAIFLSILFSLNLLLAAFNMLPIPPLDGNTAIGLFLSKEQALRFAELSHNRTFSTMGLLIAWQVFGPMFSPIFRLGLNLVYAGNS